MCAGSSMMAECALKLEGVRRRARGDARERLESIPEALAAAVDSVLAGTAIGRFSRMTDVTGGNAAGPVGHVGTSPRGARRSLGLPGRDGCETP